MSKRRSWNETALDWYERSKRQRRLHGTPSASASAAAKFARAHTGISFIDTLLRHNTARLPFIDVRGEGVSWLAMTLAARFVVATRRSLFNEETNTEDSHVPRVFYLSSNVNVRRLAYVVRSTLLRVDDSTNDFRECMERIKIRSNNAKFVPVSEVLRHQRMALVVWDGDLAEATVRRLHQFKNAVLVITNSSSTRRSFVWNKFSSYSLVLKADQSSYVAHSQISSTHFAIELSGVLS